MPNYIMLRTEVRMSTDTVAEMMVYGNIVSRKWDETSPEVTATDFNRQLKEAREKGAKKLMIRINSCGGVIDHAVAMRNMLLTSGFEEIEVRIEGLCASAATILACIPGAKVYIGEGCMYMIHNPICGVYGNAQMLTHAAQILNKRADDIRAIYAARSGKDDGELKTLMEKETWYTAKEAVEAGFADEILGEAAVAAIAADDVMAMRSMYRNMPESIAAANINSASPAETGEATEINNSQEGNETMEINQITNDQLRDGNPELYQSIMQAAVNAERARINEIDELTMPGYEAMAAEAKANGTSASDFYKAVVKAQKSKGDAFMTARKEETAPAAEVKADASEAHNGKQSEETEMSCFAKEIAGYAAEVNTGNGMY